ncbi:NAD-P-binding protein [Peniophora sp. CONT]|nr:NAD-P-binding protein [Peniophora sp. CONT]
MDEGMISSWVIAPLVASAALGFYGYFHRYSHSRQRVLPPRRERVLIIGASQGIGRAIAKRYAERGGSLCIVSRKDSELEAVRLDLEEIASASGWEDGAIASFVADFTIAEELVALRHALYEKWGGIDTLIVCAGVSATRALLDIAGGEDDMEGPGVEGVQQCAQAATKALNGNYLGPLNTAVTMIPLMEKTSASPAIHLISSLGAAVPAPTRSLYGSTKAGALALYQALAIEHPSITFSYILPSTVQGLFRASAVDAESVPAGQENPAPEFNTDGLQPDAVAKRCIAAIDKQEKLVFFPPFYAYAQLLYWLWPSYIEKKAAKKYGFERNVSES